MYVCERVCVYVEERERERERQISFNCFEEFNAFQSHLRFFVVGGEVFCPLNYLDMFCEIRLK